MDDLPAAVLRGRLAARLCGQLHLPAELASRLDEKRKGAIGPFLFLQEDIDAARAIPDVRSAGMGPKAVGSPCIIRLDWMTAIDP